MDTRRTGEAEFMISLAENRYGKSRVRLVRVKRHADHHDFHEWTLEILLEGDFESCFTGGDNRKILPTDTMKNTVYAFARESSAETIEDFAKELLVFFLKRNPQVCGGQITVKEKTWEHLIIDGKAHPTTFVQSSGERQTAEVTGSRDGRMVAQSGIEDLVILKTAGSEFVGFLRDSLTTLPEASDRLFGTAAQIRWTYASRDLPFLSLRQKIRSLLLRVFADHISKSVQHTLYAMGEAVLEQVSEVQDIQLTLPNIHCLPVDLTRFGQDNPNEIFVPIDEPYGLIEARLRRA
jgi:urate oxidase